MLRKLFKSATLLTLLVLSVIGAGAQEKFTFGIKASYANTKFAIKNLGEAANLKTSGRNSFVAGATVNYHFSEKLSLQSGLFLAKKGGKFELTGVPFEEEPVEEQITQPTDTFSGARAYVRQHPKLAAASRAGNNRISAIPGVDEVSPVSAKVEATILYLEIPLNLMYTIPTNAGKIQLGAGPYYALGLSGNIRTEVTFNAEGEFTETTDEKVRFGSTEEDHFRRHDFGVNFLAGFQFNNKISINGGYGLGLSNIAAVHDGGSIKNKLFSVGLGYSFK